MSIDRPEMLEALKAAHDYIYNMRWKTDVTLSKAIGVCEQASRAIWQQPSHEPCVLRDGVIYCQCGKPSTHYGTMGERGAREVRCEPQPAQPPPDDVPALKAMREARSACQHGGAMHQALSKGIEALESRPAQPPCVEQPFAIGDAIEWRGHLGEINDLGIVYVKFPNTGNAHFLHAKDLQRASAMKFFLDTEFSDDGLTVHPISIGIVAEDGREYYAEIASSWRSTADSWIVENVGKHLTPSFSLFAPEARDEIRAFIGSEPAEFWAYWAAYDWVVFCQIMGGLMKLPKNVSPWIRDLAWLDPTLERIRALKVHNPKPHHALFDARELREQYARLTQGEGRG